MFRRSILLGALALGACGGGGGGGGLHLSFLQTPLNVSYYEWDLPTNGASLTVNVDARITGSTNASTVYVIIVDANGTFAADAPFVYPLSPNTYRAEMRLRPDLALGTYAGTLQVRLCGDLNCNNRLASGALPYTIAVNVNPTLTFTAAAPVVGKGLVVGENDADVAGFTVGSLTFQNASQIPSELRSSVFFRQLDVESSPVRMRGWMGLDFYAAGSATDGVAYPMEFTVAPHLPAGNYSGTMTFQVCRDSSCDRAFTGTSSVPYQLTVTTANLTALDPVAGAPEWQSAYGDPQRTSYLPITVNAAALAPRWISTIARGSEQNHSTDATTAGGRVFVTRYGTSGANGLYALDESDGALAWDKSFAAGSTISPMLAANGNVYLETRDYGSNYVLRGYAADTGAALFAKPATADYTSALMAVGDNVLAREGLAFNLYDGQTGDAIPGPACLQAVLADPANENGRYVEAQPPIAGEKVYFGMKSGLEIVDFGAAQSCTHLGFSYMHDAGYVALTSGSDFVASCGSGGDDIWSYRTTEFAINWQAPNGTCNSYSNNLAIANGVVYLATYGLQARSQATGALLWSWSEFDLNGAKVVVTDNMIFVKTGDRLYAIDLATHKAVWSLTHAYGSMALSPSGLLYLPSSLSWPAVPWSLVAINLR